MKKELSSPKIINIILSIGLLLLFVYFFTPNANAYSLMNNDNLIENNDIDKHCEYEVEKDIDYYLNYYKEEVKFFSKLYDYNYDDVKEDLTKRNKDEINELNIGNMNKENYKNFTHGLIKYFEYLINNNLLERQVKYKPYTGNSKYVEELIVYFSKVYENVDYKLMLSIGASESGYYKVDYMMRKNNVFGGMGSNGLITYNNIEHGVLSYIKLLSENYYDRGLTTMGSIGYVYNPVIKDGVKVVNPHWINLVTKAYSYYNNYNSNGNIF